MATPLLVWLTGVALIAALGFRVVTYRWPWEKRQ